MKWLIFILVFWTFNDQTQANDLKVVDRSMYQIADKVYFESEFNIYLLALRVYSCQFPKSSILQSLELSKIPPFQTKKYSLNKLNKMQIVSKVIDVQKMIEFVLEYKNLTDKTNFKFSRKCTRPIKKKDRTDILNIVNKIIISEKFINERYNFDISIKTWEGHKWLFKSIRTRIEHKFFERI